ncbi:cellulase family glycosylhydrolase [Kordia sp.]|uniref:cellulase family glycosylhydrolase n=1 Tax=Kordia sp. TaxID=1965332 RepID=UPI003D6B33B8
MKKITILAIFLFTSMICYSQTGPEEMVTQMGRGMNLGNVLSAPIEGNWAPVVYEQFFIDLANEGFTNVRIPTDFFGTRTSGDTSVYSSDPGTLGNYTGLPTDYVIDSTYLNRVEEIINWALNAGLIVSLDFHGATLKSEFIYTFDSSRSEYTAPTSAKRLADNEKFKAIWNAIANRFKNHSENLLFEIINEPYFHMSATEVDTLNMTIINSIRSTEGLNTTRNIIITGGGANSYLAPLQISDALITSDDYLIATFHYYQPFNFTSSSKQQYNVYNWGTLAQKTTINSQFDEVLVWSNTNNIPIYLGEFGADNENGFLYNTGVYGMYGGPVNEDRVAYHAFIAEAAISRGFPFSAWCSGNKSNKTIHKRTDNPNTINYYSDASVDTSIWVEDVKDALLGSETEPICDPSTESIIMNPNFECGYTVDWSFLSLGTTNATFSDATSNARSGTAAAKIEVVTANGYNKVLLKNKEYTQDLTGKKVTITCYAKANSNDQRFKLRVKAVENGVSRFVPSSTYNLTTSYLNEPYEFVYTVRENTSSIEIQVMCGQDTGTYFFDDFDYLIEDASMLSIRESIVLDGISVSLNSRTKYMKIHSENDIDELKLYSYTGSIIQTFLKTKTIDVSKYQKGMYILLIKTSDGKKHIKKVII